MWNGHSCPLPLTSTLILTLISNVRTNVERPPPPAAFDVDFDFDRTLIRGGCPIFRVFCERWEPRTPAARFLTLMLLLLLPVWNGHSCPLPLTLPPILTLIPNVRTNVERAPPPAALNPTPERRSTEHIESLERYWTTHRPVILARTSPSGALETSTGTVIVHSPTVKYRRSSFALWNIASCIGFRRSRERSSPVGYLPAISL